MVILVVFSYPGAANIKCNYLFMNQLEQAIFANHAKFKEEVKACTIRDICYADVSTRLDWLKKP